MDYINHIQNPTSTDYDYRRKKAFQSVSNGTVTNLMLLLDGVDRDVRRKLLISRNDRSIVLRRPSTARNFLILNPTLLASACAEWYMEIVQFLAGQEHGMSETVSVKDESNDVVDYSGVSPLCIVTITGKFKMVQILVEKGADINAQNSIGNSPLFEACFEGHISIVNYLIQKGANIELANYKNITCLMIASYANNWEIVKTLTNLGANVNKKDTKERNALFYCLASGSIQIFKILRTAGAEVISDEQSMTVIMEAAYYGQLELVKWLLKSKVALSLDPNAVDNKGRSVLFYCAEAGNVDVFEYLVTSGVEIRPAADGSTVLMMAALRGRHKLMDYFHTNQANLGLDINTRDNRGRNCLFYSVSGGNTEMLEKLVALGANVESTTQGVNLLQQAAVKGDVSFCRYLLDKADELKLDIQSRDQDGWNSLFFAIASGNLQLFQLIYERGVNAKPANDGRTLLMQAAIRGDLEVLRHILGNQDKYESDINAKDNFGCSALYMSLQGKAYTDIFNKLLERGATNHLTNNQSNVLMETVKVASEVDVIKFIVRMADHRSITLHDVDCDGQNVLFYAAENGRCDVMEYLLSLGVTLINNDTNKTIIMTAVEHGHVEMVAMLVDKHRELFLDLDHRDSMGRNILFYTIEKGQLDCFRKLTKAGVKCAKDDVGISFLMLLAAKNYTNFFEYVISKKDELEVHLQSVDNKGDSAIHYALRHEQYNNLLYLVENGTILTDNSEGLSVVSLCVERREFGVVEKLATQGIDLTDDLNRKDNNGVPYFHHLLDSGIEDALLIALIEMYFDETMDMDNDEVTMAMKLVTYESIVLKHLVEETNIDVNKKDAHGRNLLFHAVEANNLPNVKYLLSYGARFENDVIMRTPVMAAAENSQESLDCLRHLTRYNFREEEYRYALDSNDQTAVHYAVKSGNINAVQYLMDMDYSTQLKDKNSRTPFLLAAKSNHVDIVTFLAENGSDIKVCDNQSRNALHLVFETNAKTLPVTKILIGLDCDVNARDQTGRTPLMWAALHDNLRPIKYLLENGAEASLVDNEGHDALYHCPEDRDIIRILISKHRSE